MESDQQRRSPGKLFTGGIIIGVVVVVGVAVLFFKQNESVAGERDRRAAELKAGPTVKVAQVTQTSDSRELVLIGEARPFQTVTLYAKTSGYLDKMLVDKGDKVTKGQLLATITSSEIDQDYNAALADLENKRRILKRDESLLEKEYISHQDKEQSETAVRVAEARLNSIREQQQYRSLRAPFTGTITARYADPGALVQNAINASTGALPIVTVSQLDQVRVYVYVEQKDASFLKTGYPVEITLVENPDVKIAASITRITGELDAKTRMMLTEIDIANKDHVLIPGSYVQAHIRTPGATRLQIPGGALIIKGQKYFAPKIKAGVLSFLPIQIGENTGDKITVLDGLKEGDTLALNIGESLVEGQKVRIQK